MHHRLRQCHGAAYALNDGKNVYTLSDQQTPEKFAAQKVKVIGTLDVKTKTIQVDSSARQNEPDRDPSSRRRPCADRHRLNCQF